ncbi:hypothetical protein C7212DRAFT_325517 [Tuber magnatum]|uniref:CFEM domain-containing protein n=1 Tax=Tuber magnatum TaxID=42249 RepID=A0A317SQG5_9PEZI|nr:hypothetical protein C7212DRAFT_325517 [Tuber magnatum]
MYFPTLIFITILLFTLASSAQNTSAVPTGPDLTGLPRCAVACSINAFTALSGCKPDDYPCMCRDQNFINSISSCIGRSCNGEELKQATAYAKGICGSAVPTGTSQDGNGETAIANVTISTATKSRTLTTTAANPTGTTGAPNSAAGIRPGGFALGAWLLALLAL